MQLFSVALHSYSISCIFFKCNKYTYNTKFCVGRKLKKEDIQNNLPLLGSGCMTKGGKDSKNGLVIGWSAHTDDIRGLRLVDLNVDPGPTTRVNPGSHSTWRNHAHLTTDIV